MQTSTRVFKCNNKLKIYITYHNENKINIQSLVGIQHLIPNESETASLDPISDHMIRPGHP